MNWYSGNIAEAVQRSKQQGALFFVAIFGEDEPSQRLEEAITGEEIKAILSTDRYVCIRLKADSPEHLQFKQIYSNAESPCLYFISLMGAPVEIVHGEVAVAELKGTCESAWGKHSKVAVQCQQKAPAASKPVQKDQAAQSSASGAGASGSSSGATTETVPKPTIEELENDVANPNLTLDQKIERARLLAAAKAELKLKEEADDARRREKERREAGKGMAELKRWQDEQEAKKLVDERKREKREEQLLRQKIRDQIAQDRAERNMRTNVSYAYDGAEPGTSTSDSTSPKPAAFSSSVPADYSGKARLQFRMPDGSSQSHTFEQDETLGHVHKFLIDGQHVKFSKFSLCVGYPRREFTTAEYANSLRELGLLPSAALLVIPGAGGRVLGPASGGGGVGLWDWLTTLLGYLLFPVTYLFGMIQQALPSSAGSGNNSQPPPGRPPRAENRLGGGGSSAPGTAQRPGGSEAPGQPDPSSSSDLRKRNVDKKPDGNIHRLRNQESDSDDELGTWNGNSTQQKPR